ncbi:MAG: ATP-binding protein [Thermoplasmata archaeon]
MANVEDLIVIIKDQEEKMNAMLQNSDIIKRELEIEGSSLKTGVSYIITGPRRAGKSIFAFQLTSNENRGYMNFNDERISIDSTELNKVIEAIYRVKGNTDLLVFDEIQEVPGWERFISRLIDSKRVVITGSNARMMSMELATYLTGRHIDNLLLPFSFKEFLLYKGIRTETNPSTTEKSKIMSMLDEYMHIGGFPLAIKNGNQFLVDLYKDIVERDVAQRYHIRLTSKLSNAARYLMTNISNDTSYNKLSKMLEIKGKRTVQNWISYMESAYLLFKLERFSFKLKEAIMAPKKIYAIDTGVASTIALHISKGALMENLVAIELLRRKNYYKKAIEINYWKDYSHREVDFVLRNKSKVEELIQVTYASEKSELKERETKSLIAASHELKCNNLLIITWDYEGVIKESGKKIKFTPLWKWLLQ